MSYHMIGYYTLLGVSFWLGLGAVYCYITQALCLLEWEVCFLGGSPLYFPLLADAEGLVLSALVVFISANVLGFSEVYMEETPHPARFVWLIFFFIFCMNLLIFVPNMVMMLFGWDGLGLVSFLLVTYYSSPSSLSAGMLTALTNRLGDGFILVSAIGLAGESHWGMPSVWLGGASPWVVVSIIMAACTKSAQVPFSAWLPAAMAAPTPVSALVHSSTLVTAGVFVLFRMHPYLSGCPLFKPLLLFISLATMLVASVGAVHETDLKKVIALSTLSQLSVMMYSLAMGLPLLALFHLMSHAVFKALLFVCVGVIIRYNSHGQDLRAVGSMSALPLTAACFIVASLALCGTPFLAAFYSKDVICDVSMSSPLSYVCVLLIVFCSSVTGVYTFRLMGLLLWVEPRMAPMASLNEDRMDLSSPMLLLFLGSVFGGAAINWVYASPGLPVVLGLGGQAVLGAVVGFGALVGRSMGLSKSLGSLASGPSLGASAVSSAWFLSPLSKQAMLAAPLKAGFILTHTIDQGWQEVVGGEGAYALSRRINEVIISMQSNLISTQLAMGLCFLVGLWAYL